MAKRKSSQTKTQSKRGRTEEARGNITLPTTASSTISETWRKGGNNFYAQATIPGVAATLAIPHFQYAMSLYLKADETACNAGEHASAQKNYAQASKRLAMLQEDKGLSVDLMHLTLKQALVYYCKASKSGLDSGKPQSWQSELKSAMEECYAFAKNYYTANAKGKQRARMLEEIATEIPTHHLKGNLFLTMAKALYYKGLEDFHAGDFRSSLSITKDCYYPIEEATQMCYRWDQPEVRVLREDVYLLQCMSESVQARKTGDDLLEKLLKDQEDLNMTWVMNVIDWYRNAALLTRGEEIELEAAAISRLGNVYGHVLKMKCKGKEYYMKSIQLALTLAPRSLEREEWFQDAKEFVRSCQEEEEEKERKKWSNIRSEHIGSLAKDIAKLDELLLEEDEEKLVRYIYATHPPKNEKHKVLDAKSPWEDRTKQKAIMKALCHYHPDKIDMEEHGAKHKVLCEEITKILNKVYQGYKGV